MCFALRDSFLGRNAEKKGPRSRMMRREGEMDTLKNTLFGKDRLFLKKIVFFSCTTFSWYLVSLGMDCCSFPLISPYLSD